MTEDWEGAGGSVTRSGVEEWTEEERGLEADLESFGGRREGIIGFLFSFSCATFSSFNFAMYI